MCSKLGGRNRLGKCECQVKPEMSCHKLSVGASSTKHQSMGSIDIEYKIFSCLKTICTAKFSFLQFRNRYVIQLNCSVSSMLYRKFDSFLKMEGVVEIFRYGYSKFSGSCRVRVYEENIFEFGSGKGYIWVRVASRGTQKLQLRHRKQP